MNAFFALGFMLPPLCLALAVFAGGGMLMGVSTKDSVMTLLLAVVPCGAAFLGFVVGRGTQAFSAAPLRSSWRAALVAGLGVACAAVSLPMGALIFSRLHGYGALQLMCAGLWFMVCGMVCGHFYGPTFRRLARAFPRLRAGDTVSAHPGS